MATIDLAEITFEATIARSSPCRVTSRPAAVARAAASPRDFPPATGIRSIPTPMAFRDCVLVFSQPGVLNAASWEELIAGVKSLDIDDVRVGIAAR